MTHAPILSLSRFCDDALNASQRVEEGCVDAALIALFSTVASKPLAPMAASLTLMRRVYFVPMNNQGNFSSPTLRLIVKVALEILGLVLSAGLYRALCFTAGITKSVEDAFADTVLIDFGLRLVDGVLDG